MLKIYTTAKYVSGRTYQLTTVRIQRRVSYFARFFYFAHFLTLWSRCPGVEEFTHNVTPNSLTASKDHSTSSYSTSRLDSTVSKKTGWLVINSLLLLKRGASIVSRTHIDIRCFYLGKPCIILLFSITYNSLCSCNDTSRKGWHCKWLGDKDSEYHGGNRATYESLNMDSRDNRCISCLHPPSKVVWEYQAQHRGSLLWSNVHFPHLWGIELWFHKVLLGLCQKPTSLT